MNLVCALLIAIALINASMSEVLSLENVWKRVFISSADTSCYMSVYDPWHAILALLTVLVWIIHSILVTKSASLRE